MFKGLKEVIDAELQGSTRMSYWNKVPTQTTLSRFWFDLSLSSGNPKAKLWFDASPLVAQQIKYSTDGGIYVGHSMPGYEKYLRRISVSSSAGIPSKFILCDYLLYYPTIDDSETNPQIMDNTNTLPRYTDGQGVQMMAVSLASRVGGKSYSVTYTNQDGVSGRVSQTVFQNGAAAIGTLQSGYVSGAVSFAQPFIGLQSGDTGVRSVESVTMNTADSGFFAIVLVKPICSLPAQNAREVTELDLLLMKNEMPRIYDDAFLNFIIMPNSSLNGSVIRGYSQIIYK